MVLVGVGHRHPKLVPSEAAACVGGAHRPLKLVGQDADRLVAHMVPVLVVDLLQVVEVDHHQRQPALMPLRGCDGAVDRTLELRTIGKSGQVIGARLLGVLARAVKRYSNLVRDGSHELQV